MDHMPDVYRATWLHDDHINELSNLLAGVEADKVENRLLEFVEEFIEPTGWKAVWQRATSQEPSCESDFSCKDQDESEVLCHFIVEVVNVNQSDLEAEVKYCKSSHSDLTEDELDKEFTVHLKDLYPLAAQENEVLDIGMTAEVVEQIRFFYKHIRYPWDLEEESCCYDEELVRRRMNLYRDIENGNIPLALGRELRSLMKIGNSVLIDIQKLEGCAGDDEVDQSKVSSLFRLHKSLETVKSRFDMLQDPMLREFSNMLHPLDYSLSRTSEKSLRMKVKIVIDGVKLEELASLSKLPDLIKNSSQVPRDVTCQSFATLQQALNAAAKDDIIVILAGKHTLQRLSLLSGGGTIIGLGEGVVIEGAKDIGDVLFDITGDFYMQNVTLRPTEDQVAIIHHKGKLVLEKTKIEGGSNALLGLGKTYSSVRNCSIKGCSDKGMDFREGAIGEIHGSSIVECAVGIQAEDDSKVSVSNCIIKSNSKYGIFIKWPQDSDLSSFKNIPPEELMKSLLHEYEGNTLDQNGEDAVVLAGVTSTP